MHHEQHHGGDRAIGAKSEWPDNAAAPSAEEKMQNWESNLRNRKTSPEREAMLTGFPYLLVEHWAPRNILRSDHARTLPAQPRHDEARYRLALDLTLIALKPFENAWNTVQAAVRQLLHEQCPALPCV